MIPHFSAQNSGFFSFGPWHPGHGFVSARARLQRLQSRPHGVIIAFVNIVDLLRCGIWFPILRYGREARTPLAEAAEVFLFASVHSEGNIANTQLVEYELEVFGFPHLSKTDAPSRSLQCGSRHAAPSEHPAFSPHMRKRVVQGRSGLAPPPIASSAPGGPQPARSCRIRSGW